MSHTTRVLIVSNTITVLLLCFTFRQYIPSVTTQGKLRDAWEEFLRPVSEDEEDDPAFEDKREVLEQKIARLAHEAGIDDVPESIRHHVLNKEHIEAMMRESDEEWEREQEFNELVKKGAAQ